VNHDVVNDPRVEIVHDDARHYLFTTDETFDLITADPIHPWMKGAAALYTEEYFELSRRHLEPGGVITQWVPLYETTTEVVKSELATFFRAFPRGLVWGNTQDGKGYDLVLSAREGDPQIDVDALAGRLRRPDHQAVRQSLSEVGFASAFDVLSTYGGYAPDLRRWLADAQINRDGNLRLMYLAGLGLNHYESADIWSEILTSQRFPDEVFRGSPETIERLQTYLGRTGP
ncbi:MAG TPA: hypothetical protein VE173_02320, partial [Longimicrobiales bacterium]|nr:hypothetical protein [Longimicrobiales bacterium]